MIKKIISFLSILLILPFNYNVVAINEDLSGESYVLIEENSGRVLASFNENKKMPMASTTKIMTALLALEKGEITDQVKIKKNSINVEGSSIYLKENEIITLEDLLYGLMLRSGNDAAVAIGEHIGSKEDDFIEMMNKKTKLIGANNTNFVNPHGLSDLNHYSTSYDLSLITREAFKNKNFEKIVNSKNHTAKRKKNEYFINKNKTLWEYSDGDGVKTGYTMESGRCLVSSASRNNMRLIAVSLNAYNWFDDNYKLLDYGFDNFKNHLVYDRNQFIKDVSITNGKQRMKVVTENDFIYPLNGEEEKQLKSKIILNDFIYAPVEKGDIIGRIETYLNGILINKDNLICSNKVNKQNFIYNLFKSKI